MVKVLANDGIDQIGQDLLEKANFQVVTEKVAQEDLVKELPNYDVIIVRSATKVRKELIDHCPNLKIIARAGVGLDNIDVDYAKSKGIEVVNTPGASSSAVAELVFAHMFSIARSLYKANREMPNQGDTEFKQLKKSYSKGGFQLQGKTLGVIGLGRIGQETTRIGLALGMQVLPVDPFIEDASINIQLYDNTLDLAIKLHTTSMEDMLAKADIITLHIPFTGKAVIGADEFAQMKDGVVLINAARGGTVDEVALLTALNSGKVIAAGIDVFDSEPTPRKELLAHPNVSLTPHIGASTKEAQANIATELADKIIAYYSK